MNTYQFLISIHKHFKIRDISINNKSESKHKMDTKTTITYIKHKIGLQIFPSEDYTFKKTRNT